MWGCVQRLCHLIRRAIAREEQVPDLLLAAWLFGAALAGQCGDVASLDGDDGWVEFLNEPVRLTA